jgi:hypothetical protein
MTIGRARNLGLEGAGMNTNDYRTLFLYLRTKRDQTIESKARIKAALAGSPIPVPAEIHNAILRLFITDAIEVLRAHPGFELEEKIRSVRTTYELFKQASSDLMCALDVFDEFSQRAEFNHRSRKDKVAAIESRIRKEIFAFSALAHSLQDHCRRLRSDWEPPGTAEQIAGCFGNDGLHDFICGLRTALHHRSMVEADWLITGSGANATSHYVYKRPELQAVDNAWNKSARLYLDALPREIDVRDVAQRYVPCVRAFYDWLLTASEAAPPPAVADYRRCWNAHRQHSVRSVWRFLLMEFLKQDIDPYSYLERYLTPGEIGEAMRFPKRSPEQVDFIIAAVDERSACDDELRSLIYRTPRKTTSR